MQTSYFYTVLWLVDYISGFFVPFIYLPDNAVEKGIPRDKAAFLLSIIGIANTVARVLCGWVSDQTWADCLMINNLALVIGGVATMCAPFCNSYGMMAAYAFVFGACIGKINTLYILVYLTCKNYE